MEATAGILAFLDTDVLIEYQRGSSAAIAWAQANSATRAVVPAASAFELLVGSANGIQLEKSRTFLRSFDVEPLTPQDTELALDLIYRFRLQTGLGLGDFLIASQVLNRDAVLYTFNLKHFRAIPALDARAPYLRGP